MLRKPRDVIGGFVVVAIGAAFLLLGRDLEFGDSFRMGPGYFPVLLSILMIALGIAMIVPAWRAPREGGTFDHIPWRGLLLIVGSTVLFGLTARGIGIAPAIALVVFLTASASRYARWTTSVALAIGMATFCTLLFIYALGLPLPIFGPWLSIEHWSPAAITPAQ